MADRVSQGFEYLAENGLNLQAVFDCPQLPVDVDQTITNSGVPLDKFKSLVLLGHGGKRLWQAMQAAGAPASDPVDRFSLQLVDSFIAEFLDSAEVLILYPLTTFNLPLQRLGELAEWHHPSPLGIGINQRSGLWFAYRAAFVTTQELPTLSAESTPSPCDTCADKPCISVCPADAVGSVGEFSMPNCFGCRLQPNSRCRDRCLSRLACPVAPEHQYSLEQVQYHYLITLDSIRAYQTDAS